MVSLKKHEYVKTAKNSGCKDIFVILFSGEMVNLVSSTNDTNFFTPTSTTCPIKLYNVYKQEV